jgi:putative thioredoxin
MVSFDKEVLQASYDKPVLVDFWAAWCGPCRMLGPTLEQLAEEQSDKWTLVKVNTEEHQELSQEYQIMSIPAVKLFHKGEVIGEFVGALPRNSIIRWLVAHLPTEEKGILKELREQYPNIPDMGAIEVFSDYVKDFPNEQGFLVEWLKHLVFFKPEIAINTALEKGIINQSVDLAEDLHVIRDWMQTPEEPDSAVSNKICDARKAILKGDHEEAIQAINASLLIDKSYASELPRRIGVALFRIWGIDHPLTLKYRKVFDMYLY